MANLLLDGLVGQQDPRASSNVWDDFEDALGMLGNASALLYATPCRSLGEALVAALPQRLCCSSHACCCLDKVSEAAAAAAAIACPRCGAAYCSKVCFESHWKQHKVVCKLAAGGRCK